MRTSWKLPLSFTVDLCGLTKRLKNYVSLFSGLQGFNLSVVQTCPQWAFPVNSVTDQKMADLNNILHFPDDTTWTIILSLLWNPKRFLRFISEQTITAKQQLQQNVLIIIMMKYEIIYEIIPQMRKLKK